MSQTEKERSSRGGIASIVGILANLLLATGKIITGALFGAVSVLADGLNNLTDCGSSVISLVSFKLSSKPADKEHPYGHEPLGREKIILMKSKDTRTLETLLRKLKSLPKKRLEKRQF